MQKTFLKIFKYCDHDFKVISKTFKAGLSLQGIQVNYKGFDGYTPSDFMNEFCVDKTTYLLKCKDCNHIDTKITEGR